MRKNNFLRKAVHPLFVIGLALPLLATHCEEYEVPSIKMYDQNFKEVTGDTIDVALNSSAKISVEVYYENGVRTYTRIIDDGEVENLKNSNDFQRESNESYAGGGWFCEESKITTNFADSVMNVGSLVTIKVQLGTYLSESVYFKVVQ